MGRHSRGGRQSPGTPGAAAHNEIPRPDGPRPGAARGRGAGVPPQGAAAGRGPEPRDAVRPGGHPEQREQGGAWGAGPAVPRPAGRGGGYGPPQGPRQEYLEAFDGADDGAPPPSAPVPAQERGPEPESGPEETGEDAEPSGGRTRTVAGVAAAAVTTVLAVIVAGQVASGETGPREPEGAAAKAGGERDRAGEAETASRSAQERKKTAPAGPATYSERMARPLPIDPGAPGTGRFRTVPGHEKGPEGKKTFRYRVQAERGLTLDSGLFTEAVHKTLNDKRSWAHDGERSFERVSSGRADFVVTLATPSTTDAWCAKSGLDTSEQRVSCDSAATDRVMVNGYRWARGAKTFGLDRMKEYRQMLINHEVGHRIGHGHVGCPKNGTKAPVMMQQTKSLTTGDAKCRPNAWVYPED